MQAAQAALNSNVCDTEQCTKSNPFKFAILSGNYLNTFFFPSEKKETYSRRYIGSVPICVDIGSTHSSITYSKLRKKCSAELLCTGFSFSSQVSPSDSTVGTGILKSCMINNKEVEFEGRENSGTFDYWKKSVPTAGQLTVLDGTALDHETRNRFALRVKVSDSGIGGSGRNILSDVATFVVDISNLNEAPIFVGCETPISLFVNEHRQGQTCNPNRVVGRVQAKDVDQRFGDTLSMSIEPVGAPFAIDANGRIRTSDSECDRVDYEKKKTWNIIVKVLDAAGLQATCDVTIEVHDLNEHPILTKKSTSVSNSLAVGSEFGKPIVAVDHDVDQKHSYYVMGGSGKQYIGIHIDTGKLFVKSDMASITSSTKQILVRVHDNGPGKLMTQQMIDVNIINNNRPPTMEASFSRTFSENSQLRALIGLPLSATDPDGDNKKIKFHKVSGDTHNCFSVDNYGGQIRLRNLKKECNDYELRRGKPWAIVITAVDSGAGALTVSTVVSIVVTDVNELPQWSSYQKTKHFYVHESAEVGSAVAAGAFALDQDLGTSLSYSITSYSPQNGASTFRMKSVAEMSNVFSLQSYSADLISLTEYISGIPSKNRQALSTSSGLVELEEYTNTHAMWDRASFYEIPGLSGESATGTQVSYESLTYAGHYLFHDGSTVYLKKRTTDLDFDASATFIVHSALFAGAGDGDVSLECANKLGSYLMRDTFTGDIRVVARGVELETSTVFSAAASWYRKTGLALSGTYGSVVITRPLDYDEGPRKFSLTLRATDTGETGCQNIVRNYRVTGVSVDTAVEASNVWECCSACGSNANCRSYAYNKQTNECQFFKETFVRPACYPSCTSNALYDSGSSSAIFPYVNSLFTESTIYIHVLDVNEPPLSASKTFSVAEDAKTGQIVGTMKGRDPDKDQTIKYAIQRENCFEVSTGPTKAYKQLPPVYQGKGSSTVHARVKSAGSVHVLLARASAAIEVTFAGPGKKVSTEIRYCKMYTSSPVPTVDQCETFATTGKEMVSNSRYQDLWVHVNTDTNTVTAGQGPDPGAFESTVLTATINATLAPLRYSVSTGYGNKGHFAGVCLPVKSEQDGNFKICCFMNGITVHLIEFSCFFTHFFFLFILSNNFNCIHKHQLRQQFFTDGVFVVDEITGVIRIRKPVLDYEVRDAYGIQMVFSDEGPTAVPKMTSTSFVRVNVIDVNEPPTFEGAAPGVAKTTLLVGCFYDKFTAVTPRLDPDPLRDLSIVPSMSGVEYRDVVIGSLHGRISSKTVHSSGVLDCSPVPVNRQHRGWRDQFKVEVDSSAGTIKTTRLDHPYGWGQNLVLRCVVSNKFLSGATKQTCEKACVGFKYFGLQGNGECRYV